MFEGSSAEAGDSPCGDRQHDDQRLMYRFASAADLKRFYGELPAPTIRAVVVLKSNDPVVILGVANRADCATFFADYKPEAWEVRRAMTVLRAIKKAMQIVKDSKRPVYAVRQEGTDLLVRLGFEQVSDEVYRWVS
jgi:hypothetical protein